MLNEILNTAEKRIDDLLPEVKNILMEYVGKLATPETKEELKDKFIKLVCSKLAVD